MKTDVLVIGGGTAGCFAAISAARMGQNVLLVEKNGMPGGTMTVGQVNFPGLFFAWGRQIIAGPCWEAINRVCARGGGTLPEISYHPGHHWEEQIRLNIFDLTVVLEEMCRESGVKLLYHTVLASLKETENGVIAGLSCPEGPVFAEAHTAIDCTGDAVAVRMAGCPTVKSAVPQPATLIHDLGGYGDFDEAAFRDFYEQACREGRLTLTDSAGDDLCRQIKGHRISLHVEAPDTETGAGRTNLEITARARLARIVDTLKTFEPLKNMTVSQCAAACGVRESVRIVGKTTVTAEDYVAGRHYDDGVCHAFYPIDRHVPEGIRQVFLDEGVVPEIPLGALIPKNSRFLLAAGRCVSSDADANSALRVQAPCMAMGQAAGVTAALASRLGCPVDRVPWPEIVRQLKNIGAIVPEEKRK